MVASLIRSVFRSRLIWGLVLGCLLTLGVGVLGLTVMKNSSTNAYCESCHVHPQATATWKQGAHYRNPSGVVVACVDCHLPPEGLPYFVEKAKAGARDLYGYYFTDVSAIDWEAKSTLEEASRFTFEESCLRCHQELFPVGLNNKGVDAHLHYRKHRDEVRCINCHLRTGHFHEGPEEQIVVPEEVTSAYEPTEPPISDLEPGAFSSYTEEIPGTSVRFEMVALEGGRFEMGTPDSEIGHREDESPAHGVSIGRFWMGKFEVSWREFDAYYAQTVTRGKNEKGATATDALTGPTPPYGSPDQGWGKGSRPAITMTYFAATKYCEWLSQVTGRRYRLPTEAEWEYAVRAGTTGPFFFQTPDDVSWSRRWLHKLFGSSVVDEDALARYATYRANSRSRTRPAATTAPNPWGLYDMIGNVREFCLDRYQADAYAREARSGLIEDPTGPSEGREHVVRGGSFKSEPLDLRSGARDHTQHGAWLRTDPQTPKSVWWYSDCNDVGFRVVRDETPE